MAVSVRVPHIHTSISIASSVELLPRALRYAPWPTLMRDFRARQLHARTIAPAERYDRAVGSASSASRESTCRCAALLDVDHGRAPEW